MNVQRMPATAGVVLGLLITGSLAGIPVFAAAASEEGGPVVTRQLQVGGFAELKLRGAWKLQFTQASEYSVVLTGNQETVAAAEVVSDGDRLAIHLDGSCGGRWRRRSRADRHHCADARGADRCRSRGRSHSRAWMRRNSPW